MELNERIRMIMNEKGLTQKELSQKANITEASMSKYLSGERTPRIDVIVNVANALDISVDSLLGGKETTINGLADAKLVLVSVKGSIKEQTERELLTKAIKYSVNNLKQLKKIIIYSLSINDEKVLKLFEYASNKGIEIVIPCNILKERNIINREVKSNG